MTEWIFEYKAIFPPYTQRIISGEVRAHSAEEARATVLEMGYTPTTIVAVKPATPEKSDV